MVIKLISEGKANLDGCKGLFTIGDDLSAIADIKKIDLSSLGDRLQGEYEALTAEATSRSCTDALTPKSCCAPRPPAQVRWMHLPTAPTSRAWTAGAARPSRVRRRLSVPKTTALAHDGRGHQCKFNDTSRLFVHCLPQGRFNHSPNAPLSSHST